MLEDCRNIDDYIEYLQTKAENHNCLKIYGLKNSIEKIANDKNLYFF